jgi:hypothetical protein
MKLKEYFLVFMIVFLAACNAVIAVAPIAPESPLTSVLKGTHKIREVKEYTNLYRIEWQSPRGGYVKVNMPKDKVLIAGNSTVEFQWTDTQGTGSVQNLFDKNVLSAQIK